MENGKASGEGDCVVYADGEIGIGDWRLEMETGEMEGWREGETQVVLECGLIYE